MRFLSIGFLIIGLKFSTLYLIVLPLLNVLIIHDISKSKAISLLQQFYNSVLDDRGYIHKMHIKIINIKNQAHYHYENLIKLKNLHTKNIFIDKKSYKHLAIYFNRYHLVKSIIILNLFYDELLGKVEEYEGKKILHG